MNGIRRVIIEEPVMCQSLIVAGIAIGTSFGLGWTAEQIGTMTAFSALLLAFLARAMVTPSATFDRAVENVAEAIITDQAEPLTPEERATLDALRRERDMLRLQAQRKGI